MKRLYLRCRNKALRTALRRVVRLRPREPNLRIGTRYGGWIVPLSTIRSGAVCYCAGLGEDGSFDRALAEEHGCRVFTFDPTPRAITYAETKLAGVPGLQFTPRGLWSKREVLRFYAPQNSDHVSHSIVNLQGTTEYFEAECESVTDAMADLGHDHIDLLKLDVEGAEYEVLESMLTARVPVTTVCVEFDQPAPFWKTIGQIRRMQAAGYEVVAIEGWNVTFHM